MSSPERDAELADVVRHVRDVACAWDRLGQTGRAHDFLLLATALELGTHRPGFQRSELPSLIAKMLAPRTAEDAARTIQAAKDVIAKNTAPPRRVRVVVWRRDGWPLCPLCGEDELAAVAAIAASRDGSVALREQIDFCYRCGPLTLENPAPPGGQGGLRSDGEEFG